MSVHVHVTSYKISLGVASGHVPDAVAVAKKENHQLDKNKLHVTLATEDDEEDWPEQHKVTRSFSAESTSDSSSDDESSYRWSEGQSNQQKPRLLGSGSHTQSLRFSAADGTRDAAESKYTSSARAELQHSGSLLEGQQASGSLSHDSSSWNPQHQACRQPEVPSNPAERTASGHLGQAGRVSSAMIDCQQDPAKSKHEFQGRGQADISRRGPITHKNNCGNNYGHGGTDLMSGQSHIGSLPQTKETKIQLGEQILRKVMSDHILLRTLTTDLKKNVDGKFKWKQPDCIIIMCLKDYPPHDWEYQAREVVNSFVQKLGAESPTATSTSQKPDNAARKDSNHSKMHETPIPPSASDRQMPAPDMQEDTIPNLKPHQLKFLSIPTALERFRKGCPGFEVTVDEEEKTAVVRAPEGVMKKAFTDVLSFVTLLQRLMIPLSPALVKMCKKDDARDWIQKTMTDRHGLVCHWELCDDHIVVSGQNSDFPRLEELFKSAFTETKFRIEEKDLLKSPAWLSFLESLQEDRAGYPAPVLLPEDSNIIIVDTPSNVSKTRCKLEEFFKENKLEEKTLKISQNHLKFLKHHCTGEMKEVHKRAKDVGVSVTFDKTGMVAQGPKDNLPGVVGEVKELVSRIKEDKMTFKKPGSAKYLTGSKGQELLSQTGQATECFITTSGDGKMSSTHPAGHVLAEVKLDPDHQLLIVQGDITQYEVDGIVNAANKRLSHGGGVAAAIVKAGKTAFFSNSVEY